MPAYKAQQTIARAVASVLAQDCGPFELVIVADDHTDYRATLAESGIADPRIRFLESGLTGGGSPPARNAGLDAASYRFCAILDADDRFAPGKLARMLPVAERYGLASCALDVTTPDGAHLRYVGKGEDRLLSPTEYKFTNFSMDSMLVYDRERSDPRFDPDLQCMTDLDFLLRLFKTIPACYHLGTPLHDYVKMPVSVSNGPGVTEKMVRSKTLIRERLANGHYGLDAKACASVDRFLQISLKAERDFATRPGGPALFEDHIEPRLAERRHAPYSS